MSNFPQLVYVFGTRGPVPQVWYTQHYNSANGKPYPTLQRTSISEEDAKLSISALEEKYPYVE
jgi:hypothetical protein